MPRAGLSHRAAGPGRWRELLNTDAAIYGGSGMGNLGGVEAEAMPWHGRPVGRADAAAPGDAVSSWAKPDPEQRLENTQGGDENVDDHLHRPGALSRDAMAYVLAGGRGSRLHGADRQRAKPAVYFGGKARIIDFALSNALNSGIRRIGVATQYKAHSLIRHLQRGWNFFRPERNESFDILPASQRVSEDQWYAGTADAVYQNIDIIESYDPEYMVILAGDHVYKMDYELMLQQHVDPGADVTVGCLEVPRMEATGFGVMHVDEQDRIISFLEKPKDPPGMPDNPDMALASMGIYVFETKFLFDAAAAAMPPTRTRRATSARTSSPISSSTAKRWRIASRSPASRSDGEAEAYWRDVGTVDAYWEANIDLTDFVPALDLYDQKWPIWTYGEITPPAKFVHDEEGRRGMAVDSLVSGGCIVSGAALQRSLLFTGVRVNSYATDRGRGDHALCRHRPQRAAHERRGRPRRQIPEGLVVGEDPELDAQRFRRTERASA